MVEIDPQAALEATQFNASKQADKVQVTPKDLNDRGERFAVTGGRASELPEHLWKTVRTPAFKEWFGEWEEAPVEKFQTAKGSVYSYDKEGRTSRFKEATSEQHEPQDITVFADLGLQEEQDFLEAYRLGKVVDGKKLKIYVVEKTGEQGGKVIRKKADIVDPSRVAIAVLNGREGDTFTSTNVVQIKRASMQPAVGLNVFDTRQFTNEQGETMTERHLGNKITDIKYAVSDNSVMLARGEPEVFQDPSKPDDPHAKCFIKSRNPYRVDSETFEGWVKQFTDPTTKRAKIMEAIKANGYDGVIIDGRPIIDAASGKPYFDETQILRITSPAPITKS